MPPGADGGIAQVRRHSPPPVRPHRPHRPPRCERGPDGPDAIAPRPLPPLSCRTPPSSFKTSRPFFVNTPPPAACHTPAPHPPAPTSLRRTRARRLRRRPHPPSLPPPLSNATELVQNEPAIPGECAPDCRLPLASFPAASLFVFAVNVVAMFSTLV